MAKAFAKETCAEFISPYSDADVIAGEKLFSNPN